MSKIKPVNVDDIRAKLAIRFPLFMKFLVDTPFVEDHMVKTRWLRKSLRNKKLKTTDTKVNSTRRGFENDVRNM
jgi:hypothetical protein